MSFPQNPQIYEEAIRLAEAERPFVLATVVHTKGSTPQKAGAKMLVREDSSFIGTLGGGCVEGDIWYLSREMLRERASAIFKTYKLNAEMAARDGLVCGGTMYFFIEPVFNFKTFLSFARPALAANEGSTPLTIATIVESNQPDFLPSQKWVIRPDKTIFPGLSDNNLRSVLLENSDTLSAFGENCFLAISEKLSVYLEGFTTAPALVILGGGHVGKAVCELAAGVGFHVIIIDDRDEFANPDRFPTAAQTIVADFDAGISQLNLNQNSYVLIATRGHRYDDVALNAALSTPARYIGLLGSKRKSVLIFKNLLEKGITRERLSDIHAPVGLDIGALSPEELAVSIVAELIAIRRSGNGGWMKMASDKF